MAQLETIKAALAIVEPRSPRSPIGEAIIGVLKATEQVKDWEAKEGDVSECECDQCVTATALAQAVIQEAEELA